MKIKNFIGKMILTTSLLASSLNFCSSNKVNAQVIDETVENVVADFRMGERDSYGDAENYAVDKAKRVAAERVYTVVMSHTDVKNAQVVNDEIMTYTLGHMQILQRHTEPAENGTVCRATITARVTIDTDEIDKIIDKYKNPGSTPSNDVTNVNTNATGNVHSGVRILSDGTVEAQGQYQMGGNDSQEQAKKIALQNAIDNASMTAGVQVESFVKVHNYVVTDDTIKTYTKSLVKIISSTYSFDNFLCKVTITARVDADENSMKTYFDGIAHTPVNPTPVIVDPPVTVMPPVTVTPPPIIVNQPAPMNDTISFEGHRYQIVDGLNLDYRKAEEWCKNHGGHLVYIESQQEQTFLNALLLTKGTKNCYWIGGQRGVSMKKWYWGDQRSNTMKYTNWADGQPDNFTKGENILMMYRMSNPKAPNQTGQWNDIGTDGECNGEDFFGVINFGFICEWDY